MPLSRRRKKRGKKVGNGTSKNLAAHNMRVGRFKDQESGVTLQDLINVVAAQEKQIEDGVLTREEVEAQNMKTLPVVYYDEEGNRIVVGEATADAEAPQDEIVVPEELLPNLSPGPHAYSIDNSEES